MCSRYYWYCAIILLIGFVGVQSQSDDSPGFFLKITKNVPRLGRRSDREYDSFFVKNTKTIPRIGRSGSISSMEAANHKSNALMNWLNSETTHTWLESGLNKRKMLSAAESEVSTERAYSVVQPVNSNTLLELLDKNAIPSDNIKFVHWKDFDRALQMDLELYAKVVSLGRKPDQRLKQDLGYSAYVPISFFGNPKLNERIYNSKDNNELYADKYDRDMIQYNQL